jgi:pyrimidine deaminase RibD-like protein
MRTAFIVVMGFSVGQRVSVEVSQQEEGPSADKLCDMQEPELHGLSQFMALALDEGRKALPACLPNPPVGCVLVREGHVIAKGHTNPPGGWHAEAMALAQIEGSLADVSVFVTLEPCSFHGRTPSCAQELVKRQLPRVFVAMLDPDPRNSGAGIEILRRAGIEVSVGLLEPRAQAELGPWLARPDNIVPGRT